VNVSLDGNSQALEQEAVSHGSVVASIEHLYFIFIDLIILFVYSSVALPYLTCGADAC